MSLSLSSIKLREKLLVLLSLTFLHNAMVFSQQAVTIKGFVSDSTTGQALPGVSVLVLGESRGTVTDDNGVYSISASANMTLVFRHTGYAEKRFLLKDQRVINVVLVMEGQQLDEVVVMAFGQQKKTSVTAAVSTMKGQVIAGTPVTNVSNGLAGRVSGVIAKQGSGEPGLDGSNIYIRGISST